MMTMDGGVREILCVEIHFMKAQRSWTDAVYMEIHRIVLSLKLW